MNLHILKYNNYFNRFMKKEASLSAYISASEQHHVVTATNFNENDGVSTAHVVNFQTPQTQFEGDYAILEEGGQIVSRWFVLENQWTRKGQYILTLRRDLIVDYLNEFKDSPMYIKNGSPASVNDPSIFNPEPVEYNQIKKSVTEIKDYSRMKYALLYVEPFLGAEPTPRTASGLLPTWPTVPIENVHVLGGQVILDSKKATTVSGAPYTVLAIPLTVGLLDIGSTTYGADVGYGVIEGDVYPGIYNIVSTIAEGLGGTLFDLQELPYSPFEDSQARPDGKPGQRMPFGDVVVGEFEFESIISGRIKLPILRVEYLTTLHEWLVSGPTVSPNMLGYKYVNQCYRFRLCDQFGGSVYEYNLAKNRFESRVKVYQTVKPYAPLVAIQPVYASDGLYGSTSDEKRSMISRGPYTLPRNSDAWANWAQNNINYQRSFDRSVENMETNFAISNKMADLSAVIGVVSGVAGAATQGAFVGGPAGAVIGGVAGGAANIVGAAVDISLRRKQQQESIDFAKDQFAMSIANIKARPDTIASLSAYDGLSSRYPYIEVYEPTNSELEWFANHMRLRGCTIERIGTFAEAIFNVVNTGAELTRFVRGTLLRCNLPDAHMANELASELMKGVYIYVDSSTA